ncbi:hypothetical protein ACX40Y_11310 [Sphingomonas sp. RS6]
MPDERFTGGFSAVPGEWLHGEGIRITALGLPPQPASGGEINYFREAEFYLEGNSVTVTEWSVNQTPVRMHDGSVAPQGSIGFSVEIGAGEGAVTAGDAILYCYLRGEHGLERRIEIPLVINVDRTLDATRRKGFVDPVAGRDDATGTRAAPWRTLHRALDLKGVGDGGLVTLLRPGTYVEDANVTPGSRAMDNRRMIEVVAADGLRPDQVIITRSARVAPEGRWVVPARAVHFKGLTIDLSKMLRIQSRVPDYTLGFSACRLVDGAGENGPRGARGLDVGYNLSAGPPAMRDAVNNPLPYARGGVFLTESLFVNYTTQGARLYRNVTARESTDSFAGGSGYDDVVIDGYFVTMTRSFHQRVHAQPDLIVQSAARGPSGATLVQLAGAADFPRMGRRPDCRATIVSGGLGGRDGVQVLAADPSSNQLLLEGDLTALAPGDRLRFYLIWHADFCQQQGVLRPEQRGMRNTTIFRYRATSPTAQLFLTQGAVKLEEGTVMSTRGRRFKLESASGRPNQVLSDDVLRILSGPQSGEYRLVDHYDAASGTGELLEQFSADQNSVSIGRGKSMVGFAMALSILRKTGDGAEMGQFQDGHRNFVTAQNSFFSQPRCLTFRNRSPGHGHRNHVQLFNLCTRMDADTPDLPSEGLRIERCHFLEGRARGEGGVSRGGSLRFDDELRYQPLSRQQTYGTRPLIPFDSFGRSVTSASPVGAIAGNE